MSPIPSPQQKTSEVVAGEKLPADTEKTSIAHRLTIGADPLMANRTVPRSVSYLVLNNPSTRFHLVILEITD